MQIVARDARLVSHHKYRIRVMWKNMMGGWVENPEGILLPRSSLHFDDLSKLNPVNCLYRFAVGDPADQGGDKFSTVFIHLSDSGAGVKCYVRKVLHNTHGIM